jgi:hypothetical protein
MFEVLPVRVIQRSAGVTLFAVELMAQHGRAARPGYHPGPLCPGRVVTDMLEVAARQFRDPVLLVILVVACNGLFHNLSDRPRNARVNHHADRAYPCATLCHAWPSG